MINASPDTSGQTGCPFRNCKVEALTGMMRQMKVGGDVVAKAVKMKHEQHYQLACSVVFEGLHGKELAVVAPHQYFAESRRHHKETVVEKGDEDLADSFTRI